MSGFVSVSSFDTPDEQHPLWPPRFRSWRTIWVIVAAVLVLLIVLLLTAVTL